MKKSLILASLLAASSSVMAVDVNYFVGAGIERGEADVSSNIIDLSGFETVKDTTFKFKGGVIVDDIHRVSFSYAGYSDDGTDFDLALLNYDYIIPLEEKFSLAAGVHFGTADITNAYVESEIKKETGLDLSMDGLAYGFQGGLLYDITENVQLETGFAYTMYDVDLNAAGITFLELDNSTSFSIGLNYKF